MTELSLAYIIFFLFFCFYHFSLLPLCSEERISIADNGYLIRHPSRGSSSTNTAKAVYLIV